MKQYIKRDALTKFYRKRWHYSSSKLLQMSIVEKLSFGKSKVHLFLDDKLCPYHWANYIGTTIVEDNDIINVYEDKISNQCKV